MGSLRLLIVEDVPQWKDDIAKALQIAARANNVNIEFKFAETTIDARRMVRSHCFQGISIDQNMPENPGGPVSRDIGRKFISELRAWDPPGFMAIFTAYPHTEIANFAGSKAQIPYIVKSAEDKKLDDEHQSMTAASYGEYFLTEVRATYVSRVLRLVMESGFSSLRQLAHDTVTSYERFLDTSLQDERAAKDFFNELAKFRENFNLTLVSLTIGLASTIKTRPAPPSPGEAPSRIESWLREQWNSLEGTPGMQCIKNYFHLTETQRLSNFYVDACAFLRGKRNPAIHNNWVFAPEDFEKHLFEIFCFFDMVGWLMRLPIIASPYKRGENIISYVDLNRRQSIGTDMSFQGDVPEARNGRVFTQLCENGRLIALDHGFIVERDRITNRMQLKQIIR
jgi:hypothetical protein